MIRKFLFAAAAVATLGAASLAVTATPADAKGKGGFHHGCHGGHFRHDGFGFYGTAVYGGLYDTCPRRTWVINRFGAPVLRTINVCD